MANKRGDHEFLIHAKDGSVIGKLTFGQGYVGTPTGSKKTDFYVYEWYIRATGEVFYVGKGREDRYREYHEHAPEAERIRNQFDTGIRFVGENLSEEEALQLETDEIIRILNETSDCLTNKATPYWADRDNGHALIGAATQYAHEVAPLLYVSEIESHYFNLLPGTFDKIVDSATLDVVSLVLNTQNLEELKIVYGENHKQYYDEVVAMLENSGRKILTSKYAKGIKALIFSGAIGVVDFAEEKKQVEERIGHSIAVYHLIDVWKYLKGQRINSDSEIGSLEIHPIHKRVPIESVLNRDDFSKGYDSGSAFCFQGEEKRKQGYTDEAIELFDKARYNGYLVPFLYECYAKAYRKLGDLDNEIDILTEAVSEMMRQGMDSKVIPFEEQKCRAIVKKERKKKP